MFTLNQTFTIICVTHYNLKSLGSCLSFRFFSFLYSFFFVYTCEIESIVFRVVFFCVSFFYYRFWISFCFALHILFCVCCLMLHSTLSQSVLFFHIIFVFRCSVLFWVFFLSIFFFEVCPIVIFRREKERKRHWHLCIVLWLILCEAICVVQVRRLNMPVLDVNEITSHTQNLLCDDKIINKQQQGMATPVHTHAANRQRKILSFCPVRFIHDSLSLSRTHFFLSVVVDNFVVFIRIFIVIFVLFIVILASYCALNTFPWHIDSHWLCTENKEHEMESQWKNRRTKHWKMKRDVNMTRSMEFCSVASGVGNGE